MTVDTLSTFFGWMSVLNIGLLLVAGLALMTMRSTVASIHGKLFDLDEASLNRAYFGWLARYKLFTLVFAVVPYVALQLI